MPGAVVYFGALYVLEELRLEQVAEMRADDDGMPPPYIQLDCGINEPRPLSWAEERALREDLRLSIDPVCCYPGGRVYRYPFHPVSVIYGSAK